MARPTWRSHVDFIGHPLGDEGGHHHRLRDDGEKAEDEGDRGVLGAVIEHGNGLAGRRLVKGGATINSQFLRGAGAFEVRALRMEAGADGEHAVLAEDIDSSLPPRRIVAHTVKAGVLSVNLEDRPTARVFGLDPDAILDRIPMWQVAMKAVAG